MNNRPPIPKTDGIESKESVISLLFAAKPVRVWTLLALFFIGIFVASIAIMLIGSVSRNQLLINAIVQDIFAFALPALVCGWLFMHRPWHWNGLTINPGYAALFGVACVFIVSIPLLNYTIELNKGLVLPDFLSSLETMMRQLENSAAATTAVLIGDTSIGGLISGIIIIGIVGPFCEEFFFRGALQKTLYGQHPWKAVWWTAAIFSFMHFQMYGFLPRFMLGLWFGYLYLWTGSLWSSALAHILNNTATVLTQWLVLRGTIDPAFFDIGSDGNPWVVIFSILLTAAGIYAIWRYCAHKQPILHG